MTEPGSRRDGGTTMDPSIGRDGKPLDPGAYIGREPERDAESFPDGIQPRDERVAAYASRPGVDGEPDELEDGGSPEA